MDSFVPINFQKNHSNLSSSLLRPIPKGYSSLNKRALSALPGGGAGGRSNAAFLYEQEKESKKTRPVKALKVEGSEEKTSKKECVKPLSTLSRNSNCAFTPVIPIRQRPSSSLGLARIDKQGRLKNGEQQLHEEEKREQQLNKFLTLYGEQRDFKIVSSTPIEFKRCDTPATQLAFPFSKLDI